MTRSHDPHALTLFCIPHAGGTAAAFHEVQARLSDVLRVRTVEMAGRGSRATEPPFTSVEEAAADVAGAIEAGTGPGGWAVLGHSMGGLIAYEATRLLDSRGFPPARHVLLSACPPPQHGFGRTWRSGTPLPKVVEFLVELGSLHPEIAADPEAAAYYAGLLRADAEILHAYRFRPADGPLGSPVTVLWGGQDPVTRRHRAEDWESTVAAPVTVRHLPGAGHFLITQHPERFADIVATSLGITTGPGTGARSDVTTGSGVTSGPDTGTSTGTGTGLRPGPAAPGPARPGPPQPGFPQKGLDSGSEMYLDLLKKILTNIVYEDPPLPSDWAPEESYDHISRAAGLDWPRTAHTMVGLRRLDNVQECVETIIRDGIGGDFIETGVWRGGTCIFMRALLRAHRVTDRVVWAADSFQGMPEVGADAHPGDIDLGTHVFNDVMGVPLHTVKRNFEAYGLLDEQVRFLPGWFRDTLPGAPIRQLALMRLDGDLYESTMDALDNLYPKLSIGGFVIIDDYLIKVCQEAVHDFRARHGIADEIKDIDGYGAFWRRTR